MPVRPLTDYKVIKYGMDTGEIVIYQSEEDNNFQMEVVVENETVWLTQAQMAELFQTTRNNVTDYLLKGYAVHQRFDKIENELFTLKNRFNEFDLQIKNILPRSEGIFYDGQVYDVWLCQE